MKAKSKLPATCLLTAAPAPGSSPSVPGVGSGGNSQNLARSGFSIRRFPADRLIQPLPPHPSLPGGSLYFTMQLLTRRRQLANRMQPDFTRILSP